MLRKVFLLMMVLVLMLALAGCGQEQVAVDDDPVDPRRAFEGTTLRVLLKTGFEAEGITRYLQHFEEKTGITVEYEIYDEATLRTKFILDSTARTGTYDVVAIQFWHVPEYLKAGWLAPLDGLEIDAEWNSLEYIPKSLLNTYRDEEGTLFAVPVSATGGVLIYRTDIFEKHGLPTPQTTQEVLEVAAVLEQKEPDIFPFVGRGESSAASFGTSVGWAWAYGARVMDEDLNVTVNTPEMLAAMTGFVTLMRDYAPPDQAAIGWDVMSEIFRKGNAAMNFEMSGFPSVYANPEISEVAGNIGISLIRGPGNNYAQWIYGEGLGIGAFSQNKEAAWLFIQWRTSLENSLREVADGIRFCIPDTRAAESNVFKEKSAAADIEFFTDALPDILASVDAAYWPAMPEFNKVAEAFQKEISLAIAGAQSVETALSNAQEKLEEIVAEYKR